VIDIAITPNRPDALGVRGIARDLAARGLGKLIPKPAAPVQGSFDSPISISLDAAVSPKACPLFVGRYIKGVKNGPSPQWVQDRLRAIGLRPISALVDVTNLMTVDRNRPLHVFDADKVNGNITVRFAQDGETLLALDDKEYTLNSDMVVIADDHSAESIGGVMGGIRTGCSADTVNVFVEAAYFDPITIAMTGRKLKINSDARYRFERGIDPDYTFEGMELATQLILDWCGGQASNVMIAGAAPDTARQYKLDTKRVVSLVGMEISASEQVQILTDLGFIMNPDNMVDIPSWRPDVQGEADLIEEIARVASLTKLQGVPMARQLPGVARPVLTPTQKRQSLLRRSIAALGLNECVTYSFIDQKSAELFGGGSDAVRLANPISSEMSHMRPNLLPSLLQAAARNQARGFGDIALFEIGQGFVGAEPDDQSTMACGIRIGHTAKRNIHGLRRAVDFLDAKADAEAALSAIGAPVGNLMVMRNAPEWFHPGRSAVLSLGPKNPLAVFGELHPKILKEMGIKGAAVAFTIFPDNVPFKKAKTKARPALVLNDLQAVERDFAFMVDTGLEVEKLIKAAISADKKLISDISVFDIFEGKNTGGKKSVAISVRLQPVKETLTDKEIEMISEQIIAKVIHATGGALRS